MRVLTKITERFFGYKNIKLKNIPDKRYKIVYTCEVDPKYVNFETGEIKNLVRLNQIKEITYWTIVER